MVLPGSLRPSPLRISPDLICAPDCDMHLICSAVGFLRSFPVESKIQPSAEEAWSCDSGPYFLRSASITVLAATGAALGKLTYRKTTSTTIGPGGVVNWTPMAS